MTNILITGGAGFIPSSLAERLAENKENTIILVDNFITGDELKIPTSVHNNILFYPIDCNHYDDLKIVFDKHAIDYVFHYAALVGVQRTLANPLKVFDDIDGFKYMFTLCKEHQVKRIYYSSSSEVYGEPVEIPQNEHFTPLNARLPYAIVKNLGEAFCQAYHQEFGMNYTIFRFFNTYGPKQSQDFVISKFLRQAMSGEPITIYGDGLQSRTFCYVKDHIDVCEKIFYEHLHVNDIVNIGSDKPTSVLELAQLIIELTGSASKIQFLPPLEQGDMTRRRPDATKMRNILQREFTPLEEGIKEIIHSEIYQKLNLVTKAR